MAQVYISQYARRAGVADTASYIPPVVALPGGQNTQIQFNSGGLELSGSGVFTFNYNTNTVFLTGSLISSGTIYFPALTTGSQPYIVTYNSESGQLFYATASATVFEIRDEGNIVTSAATALNFTGSGVSASLSGSVVNVYIPSSSGAILLDNLLTNITVGGSDAGTLYDAGTLLETILRDILIDYLPPTIGNITLSFGAFPNFVGPSAYREVSHSLQFNTANFLADTDNPGGNYAFSASFTASGANIGNFNFYFGNDVLDEDNSFPFGSTQTINCSSSQNVTFIINGIDSASANVSSEATLEYVYPIFYGMTTASYTSSGQLESDVNITKLLTGESNKTLSIQGVNKYIYFAYPADYGDLTKIYDGNGFIVFDPANPDSSFIKYTFNQSGSAYPWSAVNYNIYKSRYITTVNPAQSYLFKFN